MADCNMDAIAIIYALVVTIEGGYKLEGIYTSKEECRLIEKEQSTLSKCFKLVIDNTTIEKSRRVINENPNSNR